MKTFLIYVAFFSAGTPLPGSPEFTNETGCYLWMRANFGEDFIRAFKLECVNVNPFSGSNK
jgi:hypothetical protein